MGGHHHITTLVYAFWAEISRSNFLFAGWLRFCLYRTLAIILSNTGTSSCKEAHLLILKGDRLSFLGNYEKTWMKHACLDLIINSLTMSFKSFSPSLVFPNHWNRRTHENHLSIAPAVRPNHYMLNLLYYPHYPPLTLHSTLQKCFQNKNMLWTWLKLTKAWGTTEKNIFIKFTICQEKV